MIDGHVHVVPGEAPAEDLLATMESHGVTRAVLVGLTACDDYAIECVKAYPETFRAILVHDLDIRPRVEAAGAHGVRLFDLNVDPGLFEWLAANDLKLWAYLHPPDYPRLVEILEAVPELAVVLNHLALRPNGEVAVPPPSWPAVAELARFPNVHVMFSGQYAFSRVAYPYADLIEYARMVYETYGAARMLWASDFPWPAQDPGYGRLLGLVDHTFPDLMESERADLLGGTCARLFAL